MICADINLETLAICQRRIPTAKCILVDKDNTTLPSGMESLGLLLCIELLKSCIVNGLWQKRYEYCIMVVW